MAELQRNYRMSQIDYVLKFADAAAAMADAQAAVGVAIDKDGVRQWLKHRVTPVTIWRNSQDTTQTVTGPTGQSAQVTVHHPLAGFYVLISLNQIVAALRDHAAVQVVIDRDKLNARQVGGIVRSTVGAAVLQDIRFEPTFLGMDVPWGALN